MEPLKCCAVDAPAREIKGHLAQHGFDVAGVKESEGGSVLGYVSASELGDGNIKQYMRKISKDSIIAHEATVHELLTVLSSKEQVFVDVGSTVKAIVTRADLNKPPVRVYFFGLVSLLEIHLSFWLKRFYRDDSWEEALNSKRLEAAQNLHKERLKRNNQIQPVDCLQFCDKRDLLQGIGEFRGKFGFESKGAAERLLTGAEKLRDTLAHSQTDLVEGSSWPELIKGIEAMESAVHKSDEAVEAEAKSMRKTVDVLWVAG